MEATIKIKKSVLIRQHKEQEKAQTGGASAAKLQNCPTSPRKMRLVIDLIRGEKVEKALYRIRKRSNHVTLVVDSKNDNI